MMSYSFSIKRLLHQLRDLWLATAQNVLPYCRGALGFLMMKKDNGKILDNLVFIRLAII